MTELDKQDVFKWLQQFKNNDTRIVFDMQYIDIEGYIRDCLFDNKFITILDEFLEITKDMKIISISRLF